MDLLLLREIGGRVAVVLDSCGKAPSVRSSFHIILYEYKLLYGTLIEWKTRRRT